MPQAQTINKNNSIEISRRVSFVLANASNKPNAIFAAASNEPPERFELLKVGMWRTPWHGDIMIMPEDLQEYVDNFNAGHAVSGNGKLKLPINYGHEAHEKAAGWFVPAIEGDTLWATDVEWTPKGAQALKDGEWKCISAEFCPKGRGGWIDPLDEEHIVENVLEGAALTNIPLYRNLEPVMASATFGRDTIKPNVFLIAASNEKELQMPTLEEIVAKANEDLTEDERNLLVAEKEKLTPEQLTKFGFEAAPAANEPENNNENKENEAVPQVPTELAEVAASIKKGDMVAIKASAWQETQDQLTELRRKDVTSAVKAHAARGAIKADQIDTWTDKVLADATMLDMLGNLPSNEVLADTQGTDENAGDATALEAELHERIVASRKEAFEKGATSGSYSEVRASIIKSDDKFKSLIS